MIDCGEAGGTECHLILSVKKPFNFLNFEKLFESSETRTAAELETEPSVTNIRFPEDVVEAQPKVHIDPKAHVFSEAAATDISRPAEDEMEEAPPFKFNNDFMGESFEPEPQHNLVGTSETDRSTRISDESRGPFSDLGSVWMNSLSITQNSGFAYGNSNTGKRNAPKEGYKVRRVPGTVRRTGSRGIGVPSGLVEARKGLHSITERPKRVKKIQE